MNLLAAMAAQVLPFVVPTLVQTAKGESTGNTTATFLSNVTLGNTLVSFASEVSPNVVTFAMNGLAGTWNTATGAPYHDASGHNNVGTYSGIVTTVGTSVVSIPSTNTDNVIGVMELSGLPAGISVVQDTPEGVTTGAATHTVTIPDRCRLAFAYCIPVSAVFGSAYPSSVSPGTSLPNLGSGTVNQSNNVAWQYVLGPTAGSLTWTFTYSGASRGALIGGVIIT